MTSSTGCRAQVIPERVHRRMKKEADVAHREPGDDADFLVGQATLEPEIDDFALVARQRVEPFDYPAEDLLRVVPLIEVVGDRDFGLFEGRVPGAGAVAVECEVPADGEEPLGEVPADALRVLLAEAQERLLHHVLRRRQVTQEASRVSKQRPLVPVQCLDYPVGFRRPDHASLPR